MRLMDKPPKQHGNAPIFWIVAVSVVLLIIAGWIVDPDTMNAIWSGMVNASYPNRAP